MKGNFFFIVNTSKKILIVNSLLGGYETQVHKILNFRGRNSKICSSVVSFKSSEPSGGSRFSRRWGRGGPTYFFAKSCTN